jgi:hypothetical protein
MPDEPSAIGYKAEVGIAANKKGDPEVAFRCDAYSLENGDVLSLPAFGALDNAELNRLAFLQ